MRPAASILLLVLLSRYCLAGPTLDQGYDAFERGDVETAVQIWRTLAEAGDATAQVNLGQLYRLGKGVPADDREAVRWYSLAVKQGSQTAKYNLILMHSEGRATREDLDMAFVQPLGQPQEPPANSGTAAALSPGASKAHEPGAPAIPKARTAKASSRPDAAQTPGEDWFWQLPTPRFVLQLVSHPQRKVLERYAADNLGILGLRAQVVHTIRKGKNHYLLLLGPFDTRQEGKDMLERLPPEVQQDKPWVRQAASVQQSVKPSVAATPAADDWFSQLPQQQYVLQLASSGYQKSLQRYASEHLTGLGMQPQVVLTTREGRDHYVLLLGPFDTRQQAKDMIARLPQTVKNNKPYARAVPAVQQVARRVK